MPVSASLHSRKWRVGVVGAGYVSEYHLRSLQHLPDVEIVGIADLDRDRAARMATAFGLKGIFSQLFDMLKGARPDVLHVLTPPSSHCAIALEALDAGCHVFVEKPMALSEDECERMMRKAQSVGRVLSVDHSARFDPAVLRGLELVRRGRIGDVLALEYIRSSEYPPFAGGALPEYYRDGGYPFRDIGVHALYVIEAFLGQIESADAWFHSSQRHVHLRFDEWQARVQCARGIAQIYLSWNSLPLQNKMVVHGTAGRLTIDSFIETCSIERALPGNKALSLIWNGTVGSVAHAAAVTLNAIRFATGRVGRGPDIQQAIVEFYSALSAGSAPPVSAEEGKRIVGWAEKLARPADEASHRLRPVSDSRPAEILVTGANGFLGRRLVAALLKDGKTVRALVRRQSKALPDHPLLRTVYGDLGQPEVVDAAVAGVTTIFHVGAATDGSQADYECGTVRGTGNVVDAALRHGVEKLVHVSSLSVLDYTRLSDGTRADETSPLEPMPDKRGLYPKTKLQAEKIVLEGVARGLNAVLVRPGQIFGPGAEHTPPYGVFSVAGRWIVAGSGRMELPLVYVDDVVEALLKAAASQAAAPGSIFHIVDDHKITQQQYIDASLRLTPDLKITFVPMPILYGAALLLETLGKVLHLALPLTTYRLRSLKGHLQFDCSAAHQQLGWQPRIGIAEGLKVTFGDNGLRLFPQNDDGRTPENVPSRFASEAGRPLADNSNIMEGR